MWPFDYFCDDEEEIPPKPGKYSDRKEETHTRYQTTLEYRNGDTEEIEHYGVSYRDGMEIAFRVSPYARASSFFGTQAKFYDKVRSFEVLSREPETEKLGEHTFVLTWDVEHQLKNENLEWRTTKWEEAHENAELEVIEE